MCITFLLFQQINKRMMSHIDSYRIQFFAFTGIIVTNKYANCVYKNNGFDRRYCPNSYKCKHRGWINTRILPLVAFFSYGKIQKKIIRRSWGRLLLIAISKQKFLRKLLLTVCHFVNILNINNTWYHMIYIYRWGHRYCDISVIFLLGRICSW